MIVRVSNIYISILIALTFLGISTISYSQEYTNTPVEISKEKVRVDGKICYSHIVKEKQTLFSISKAYEVSIEDIHKFNPSLKGEGLKKNSIILIPSKEALQEGKESLNEEIATKTVENKKTAIEKRDTAIVGKSEPSSKKSGVSKTPAKTKEKNTKRIHIAKWYEDLDVIAENYGVSVAEIMKANNLTGRKLSKRQKLVIPYPGEVSLEEEIDGTVSDVDSLVVDSADSVESQPVIAPKDKVNATIILPLTDGEGEPNRNNMDFYCGALVAIYDISENGIDCNLNVYDIMDSKSQFSAETIKGSDVIIGPVAAADLTRLFISVPDIDAVVSPLDQRAERLTAENKAIIQAPTPHYVQYKDLVKWIEEDFRAGDRVVMITEKGARQSGVPAQIKEALDSSTLAYNPFSYSILEGRDVTQPLSALMSNEGANRVIIASESEAFVNDVIRNLNLLIYNNLDIVLYAPSKVRGFETIEVENFHNTSMHVSLGYYIDYESDEVKDFLMKYRALYNIEPTQFAFQGYDLTRYFLNLASKYGDNWKSKLSESETEMLQSSIYFIETPSGSYVNNGVRRIVYDKGYQIRKVK